MNTVAPADGATPRSPGVVCVIDDNDDVRRLMCDELERAGFSTVDAPDGGTGVTLAGTSGARVAIVDMVMPDRDGFETIAELIARFPTVRILAVSGGGSLGSQTYLQAAQLLGAHDYLAKPFKLSDLVGKVTALITGGGAA